MVLDHYEDNIPVLDELIKIGMEIGAYGKSGWVHQGLINIADKFGLQIKRKEFKDSEELFSVGVKEIVKSLQDGKPVFVSAVKQFKDTDKFHMILLVGFKEGGENPVGFYYHDPDAEVEKDGKEQFVSFEVFEKYWRRMAIFVK